MATILFYDSLVIKKLFSLVLSSFLLINFFLPLVIEQNALAAYSCTITQHTQVNSDSLSVNFTISAKDLSPSTPYNLVLKKPDSSLFYFVQSYSGSNHQIYKFSPGSNGEIKIENMNGAGDINRSDSFPFKAGTYYFNIIQDGQENRAPNYLCSTFTLEVPPASQNDSLACQITLLPQNGIYPITNVTLKVAFKDPLNETRGNNDTTHHVRIYGDNNFFKDFSAPGPTSLQLESGFSIGSFQTGNYKIGVWNRDCNRVPLCTEETKVCWWSFSSTAQEGGGQVSTGCKYCPIGTYRSGEGNTIVCIRDTVQIPVDQVPTCQLSEKLPTCNPVYGCISSIGGLTGKELRDVQQICNHIASDGTNCDSVDSGLVNLPTDIAGFTKALLSIVLSIAGAAALILIIISGYRLMTSQGNPEKLQAAKEELTAAIVGLLFVIFALLVLQVIGVDILKLPGLTK